MYFPYLRGKQFELLALREFAEDGNRSGQVHPIIEPVRNPSDGTGFKRMCDALEAGAVPYTVIVNPQVGNLGGEPSAPGQILTHLAECGCAGKLTELGVLFHANIRADSIVESISDSAMSEAAVNLIYSQPLPGPANLGKLPQLPVRIHATPDLRLVRRFRQDFPEPSVVIVSDGFPKQGRNLDYVDMAESVFTDEFLYFRGEGLVGFSDYLTIGEPFVEGGSTPRAVAIHLTYQNAEDELVYIRHFCSTTNDDRLDVAGKFGEALAKLVDFANRENLANPAVDAFRYFHAEQRYPGLGTVKKLSMLNHLYLMDSILGSQ